MCQLALSGGFLTCSFYDVVVHHGVCVSLFLLFLTGNSYVQWIGTYFSACVYSIRDLVAFGFGMTNIFIWFFAQGPQIYMNYKNRSVESLSALFLFIWLIGDITNLLGI